jgi:putative glutamine amidotransferase
VTAAVTRPRILIAPHARELDTVLGQLHASIVYDRYLEKIVVAGAQPLTAWPGTPDVDDLVAVADGVLLIGGGDVAPERFGGKPVLGVCRGAQVLNVALGGTLRKVGGHRQESDLTQPSHSVQIVEGTRFAEAVGTRELEVNSFHNWAPDALGRRLHVAGTSADVIEGLEFDGGWWGLGVQWHLELLDDPASQRVFDALVAAAVARAP